MKNLKINIDRPKISSEEIRNKMNFEQVLASHQLMVKPFYKSPWFFGTTGLATVTLLATAVYGLSDAPPNQQKVITEVMTSSMPIRSVEQNEKPKEINQIKELPIENKSTLKNTKATNQKPSLKKELISVDNTEKEVINSSVEDDLSELPEESNEDNNKTFSFFDFHPRISGKVNGSITKQELFDDKGLVTNTDVEIIHFELHLVDGVGGKVFIEDGNQLSAEMKKAIKNIEAGNEIYFEDINGLSTSGQQVNLSPLRYTLLN